MDFIRSQQTARMGPALTLPSSMLELKPILLGQLLLWIMIAPLFFIPVTGVGTQVNLTLLPILGDILMAIAHTVVRLLHISLHRCAGGVF